MNSQPTLAPLPPVIKLISKGNHFLQTLREFGVTIVGEETNGGIPLDKQGELTGRVCITKARDIAQHKMTIGERDSAFEITWRGVSELNGLFFLSYLLEFNNGLVIGRKAIISPTLQGEDAIKLGVYFSPHQKNHKGLHRLIVVITDSETSINPSAFRWRACPTLNMTTSEIPDDEKILRFPPRAQ